jgi:hypothetical protein
MKGQMVINNGFCYFSSYLYLCLSLLLFAVPALLHYKLLKISFNLRIQNDRSEYLLLLPQNERLLLRCLFW